MSDATLTRAAIIYAWFGHYRRAVFRALKGSHAAHYEAISDVETPLDSLPLLYADPRDSVELIPHTRLKNRFFFTYFLWQHGVIAQALSRRFDVLILVDNMTYVSNWIALALGRLTGKRVLFWGHGFTRARLNFRERFRTFYYRLAHGHMVYGHYSRDIMLARGFDPDRVYVIYNSLDLDEQNALFAVQTPESVAATRGRLFAEPERPLLVTIGRLVARKKIDALIRAAGLLARAGRPVNVAIIGTGQEEPALKDLAAREGVTAAFLGAIYDEARIAPVMAAADLCVVPGRIGLTCMHALAYGTPVITHGTFDEQNPEFEAIAPGQTGAFFTMDDDRSLAEAITAWVDAHPDRAAARRACRAMIETYYGPELQRRIIDLAVTGGPARRDDFASVAPNRCWSL